MWLFLPSVVSKQCLCVQVECSSGDQLVPGVQGLVGVVGDGEGRGQHQGEQSEQC